MRNEHLVRPPGDHAQGGTPVVGQGVGQDRLCGDFVGHERQQVVLGGDVGVEAHRPSGQPRRHVPDRDRREPFAVGDRDRRAYDGLPREMWALPMRRVPVKP